MGVNLRDLLIFVALSDDLTTVYSRLLTLSTLPLLELTELQRLRMFLQLRTATDVPETKDLRDKTK